MVVPKIRRAPGHKNAMLPSFTWQLGCKTGGCTPEDCFSDDMSNGGVDSLIGKCR